MHTPAELSSILDKLANDDNFREHLLSDPVAALGGLGITLDPAHVPAVRSLPSRESLLADQSALHSQLTTNARMVPFLLSGAAA